MNIQTTLCLLKLKTCIVFLFWDHGHSNQHISWNRQNNIQSVKRSDIFIAAALLFHKMTNLWRYLYSAFFWKLSTIMCHNKNEYKVRYHKNVCLEGTVINKNK